MGVVLVSYLSDKEMQVIYKDTYSSTHSLPGGGSKGNMVGLIEYFEKVRHLLVYT